MSANDNFDRAFEYALRNEGGYSNHQNDPGGPTKYGITLKTLARWRHVPPETLTPSDVQAVTRDEAKAIYKRWYWDAVHGDHIDRLVTATILFDMAILMGAGTAVRIAQKALNRACHGLTVDGLIGPKTVAALNECGVKTFVLTFKLEAAAHIDTLLKSHPDLGVFHDGWKNRINKFMSLVA